MTASTFGYDARVLRVLIASPGDVQEEREALADLMVRWNGLHSEEYGVVLQPVRWELDATPEQGERPQGVINRQLVDRAEILVAVFFARLGTPTGAALSGTAEEINRVVASKRPVLLYFSTRDIPRKLLDPMQYSALEQYKRGLEGQGLHFEYASLEQLRTLAFDHLTKKVQALRAGSPTRALWPAAPDAGPAPAGLAPAMQLDDALSPARLIGLAQLVIDRNLDEEQRHWPRVRWKTIYTIDRRRRLGEAVPAGAPETLIQMIRAAGRTLGESLLAGDPQARSRFRPELAAGSLALRPPFWAEQLRPADFGPQMDARPWPQRLPASVDPEAMRNITSGEFARILLCEILVSAIVHVGTSERKAARASLSGVFADDLQPVAAVVRELLIYNGLRAIDSLQVTPPPDDSRLEPGRILEFLWPEGRKCAPELDYLVRWPHRMDVVVLSNESARASVAVLGPFPNMTGHDESYRSFVERGRDRGVSIVIANYHDLNLQERRTAAWRLHEGSWKRQDRLYSEFFYDKFPTDLTSMATKDEMAKDPRINIWNRVVFTELLADKYQMSTLLEAADVPVAAPSRQVALNSTRSQRAEVLAELKRAVDDVGLVVPSSGAWLVVKPLTGFGGKLVERMTEDQFLSADFTGAEHARFAGVVVQPFFESAVAVPELGIRGRHDVRIVFVGYTPIFGMIRELPAGVEAVAASLENVRKHGGSRRYVDVAQILSRSDARDLIGKVHVALGTAFGTPAIYSVDFFWVQGETGVTPIVVELNSKPSQVWEPGDQHGRQVLSEFHKAIVGEMSAFYDDQVARIS